VGEKERRRRRRKKVGGSTILKVGEEYALVFL